MQTLLDTPACPVGRQPHARELVVCVTHQVELSSYQDKPIAMCQVAAIDAHL